MLYDQTNSFGKIPVLGYRVSHDVPPTSHWLLVEDVREYLDDQGRRVFAKSGYWYLDCVWDHTHDCASLARWDKDFRSLDLIGEYPIALNRIKEDWLQHLSENTWFERCPRCKDDFERVYKEALLLNPKDELLDEPVPVVLKSIPYSYMPVHEIM
jgi:hypothetical protein